LRWLKSDGEFGPPGNYGTKYRDWARKFALAQKRERHFGRCWQIEPKAGAEAMSLYVLDAVLWIFGIRGPVPRDGDFPARPNRPPLAPNPSRLMRILATAVVAIAILSLILSAAVWLAIKSL
jgi:hypothetical protein